MGDVILEVAKHRYRLGHQRLLAMLKGLTEEQFLWKPTPSSHSIAFNIWHLARWADFLQATIPSMSSSLEAKLGQGRQIWDAERLAQQWGWNPATLGWNQTGLKMDDQAAANLRFPSIGQVIAYLQRAFAAAERAVDVIDDDEARVIYKAPYEEGSGRPAGSYIISYAIHDDFHRGQVAALRRAQNLPRAVA